ncbi:MAG: hypothetical protein ACE5G9_09535 [Nitrospinales bacterium]
MWKNVFIETCILSALIFGGFYLNASILKKELFDAHENLLLDQKTQSRLNRLHFSGNLFTSESAGLTSSRISGGVFGKGGRSSLSGMTINPDSPKQSPTISGNKA